MQPAGERTPGELPGCRHRLKVQSSGLRGTHRRNDLEEARRSLNLWSTDFSTASFRPSVSGMQHSPGFLKIVEEAKSRVPEVTLEDLRARLTANPSLVLIDVREDNEWSAGHAAEAVHLGKGILERDLESRFPDPDTELVLYCGGGFRSALSAEAAGRMGYRNVSSLIGGYKAMVAAGWPMVR